MLGLNKFVSGVSALAAVLMLNACASAVFPDFDDNEDDIMVSEGGRVVRPLPEEGSSLKADTENAAYEGEETEDENVVDVDEDSADDKIAAAETTPVVTDELDEEDDAEETATVVEELTAEPAAGPSISYRVDTFYFDNGSASLDAKYNPNLRKIVKMAKENNADVIVYGYASSRTRNTDPASHKLANFKVSLERAQNVAAALRRAGVPAQRITVQALSDSAPAYQEVMPEGERLNRRAEVYISY